VKKYSNLAGLTVAAIGYTKCCVVFLKRSTTQSIFSFFSFFELKMSWLKLALINELSQLQFY